MLRPVIQRQLRQLVPTILIALGVEGVMLHVGRSSAFWRELFVPLHIALGVWVAVSLWAAFRRRAVGRDRRRGDRRRGESQQRQASGGA